MGFSVTICPLLMGLAAFAGWTLFGIDVPRFVRRVNVLGGVGILSFVFSIISNNDGFEQEFIRPPTPFVQLAAHTRVAPRRSPVNLSVKPFPEPEGPIRVPLTSRSIIVDQPLELNTYLHGRIPIHSPPLAS